MFRLIKLAIYGLLGYAIYEFVRGMIGTEVGAGGGQGGQGRQQGGTRELNRALDRDPAHSNMTGPARGERVMSAEPSGESVPHTVGRGVIHQ